MKKTFQLITLLVCFTLGSTAVHAALYWDSNDTTDGAGATPTGIWGTDAFWNATADGTTTTTTAWTPGDTAVFSAGTDAVNPFTVTVDGTQTAGGITFEAAEGPVTLSGGTVTLGVASFPMIVDANATINSVLAGEAGLTKTGTGTLTLNGANTYTGLTTVSAGVIVIGNNAALGAAGGSPTNTIVSVGAQLQISGTRTLTEPLILGGTGISTTGSLLNTADNNVVGSVTMGVVGGPTAQSERINSDAGVLTLSFITATANNFRLTIGGAGDTIIGPIVYAGATGQLIKDGTGTLTVTGNCNERQSNTVNDGTMKLGVNNAFGPGTAFAADLSVTGIFDLNGYNVIVDGLLGVGSVINTVGGSIMTIGGNNNVATGHALSPTFSGVISGGTVLTKIGTGTQTFSGTNTYTGNTTISVGKLIFGATGSISNTPTINVNTNATFDVSAVTDGFVLGAAQTLKGNGTVVGNVTANGTISPGASVGSLTNVGNLTLAGNLSIEVDKALSTSNDVITVTGLVTNTGTGTVTVTNLNPGQPLVAGDTFQLFNQAVTNGAALTVVSAGGGVVWNNQLEVNGSIVVVSVTSPPSVAYSQITSIVGAGTTSVTVNYTNTLPGTNYVLRYSTNLNVTNWYDVGTKTAVGTSDFQNDSPPAGDPERYYRVHYLTP